MNLADPVFFEPPKSNGDANKLSQEDLPVHDWYRFVLSFPPHLVRKYAVQFGVDEDATILDPFCGTGTTIVECQKAGIPSIGIEALPMPAFASKVKTTWSLDPDMFVRHARRTAERALGILDKQGIPDDPALPIAPCTADLRTLPEEEFRLLLKDSISPLPLHKTLVLLDCINQDADAPSHDHEILALAKALVMSIGNLRFGPEVGIGKKKENTSVIQPWLSNVRAMATDLATLHTESPHQSVIHRADSRFLTSILTPRSISAVFTSPPYPNEKDYTRTTRLETVILGLAHNMSDLRASKRSLVRSNTRSVYRNDMDDELVKLNSTIQRLAREIEDRRIRMGKTSGFERLYHRVTKLYFGGMAQHLASLRGVLRPGAFLGYVVGDQASYLRVMIRTGHILGEIAESLGYKVEAIDLFRTRLATATGEQLREEVLVLRWPG
ncbi:MAG: DNA methyltransferase [Spirochaetia bacterium]|jgi:DNA modification methylase